VNPVPAVGVVCLRGAEVLLIRRGKPPRLGQWSLPGGRIEWGERAVDAALRELREETGVEAELTGLIAVVDGLFGFGESEGDAGGEAEQPRHYLLIDYAARWLGGDPRPGDDAAAAQWWPLTEVDRLGMWDETVRVIRAAAADRAGGGRSDRAAAAPSTTIFSWR